jgi:hypothetical protein
MAVVAAHCQLHVSLVLAHHQLHVLLSQLYHLHVLLIQRCLEAYDLQASSR